MVYNMKYVKTVAEYQKVINSNSIVVIDFYANWCGPCKMVAPKFEALSEKFTGKALFVKVDIDQAGDLATAQKVSSIPTFKIIKDKNVVETIVGANIDKVETVVNGCI